MQLSKDLELKDENVKITWCACPACSAAGPRFMTLLGTRLEFTIELNTQCCDLKFRDGFIRREEALFAMEPSPADRFAR
jgi:hypothetical protein